PPRNKGKKLPPTAIKNASTTDKDSKLLGNDSKMDIAWILETSHAR
ncbi:hypothetical protein TNIN_490041, partial [Trichonephila inaurata madagascariensis]